jgi:Uncharacterised protein family (UPF0203)
MGSTQSKVINSSTATVSSPVSVTATVSSPVSVTYDNDNNKNTKTGTDQSIQSNSPVPISSEQIDNDKLKRKQQRDEEEKSQRDKLTGMPLIHYVCRKRKMAYDKCYDSWYYTDFLPGKSMKHDDGCNDLYELYRRCIVRGVKKEVWDKQLNLPPPHPNSPLLEYDDDFK